jgi:hypothetical protein
MSDDAPFGPPRENTEVGCLHCREVYDSYRIELRGGAGPGGEPAWCCPTPGCGGLGFGFDILPTDPTYRDENGGWVYDDEESDEFEDEGWDDLPPPAEGSRPPGDDCDIPF